MLNEHIKKTAGELREIKLVPKNRALHFYEMSAADRDFPPVAGSRFQKSYPRYPTSSPTRIICLPRVSNSAGTGPIGSGPGPGRSAAAARTTAHGQGSRANAVLRWLCVGALVLTTGCTHYADRHRKADAKLWDAAQVNNQAAVDALNLQPTPRRDGYTELARAFLEQNERVLGAPVEPVDVASLVSEQENVAKETGERRVESSPSGEGHAAAVLAEASAKSAVDTLARESAYRLPPQVKALFSGQNQAVREQRRVTAKLEAMGERAEAKRNARISFWSRLTALIAVPAAGMIALLVFVPVAIPIVGRVLAWLVGRLPSLAGWIGVVSTKAFDATVRGIEHFKTKLGTPPSSSADGTAAGLAPALAANSVGPAAVEILHSSLSGAMDAEHKRLVRRRKSRTTGRTAESAATRAA